MTPYDHWKTTEPEDEEARAALRESRRNRCPVPRDDEDPHGAWADYEYDPLSRKGFE